MALKKFKFKSDINIAIATIFLFFGAAQSNLLFYSDYMIRESEKMVATRIISTIYNKYPDFDQSKVPVYFYGKYQPINNWEIKRADVFGGTFFAWDNGNNSRIINYFKINNIASFHEPSFNTKMSLSNHIKLLPTWPNPNSIKKIDNVIVIKLSNDLNKYNLIKESRRD